MSHYTKLSIAAQQDYEAELIGALKKHFGEKAVESHDVKQTLKNWNGQDSGIKSEIIVRKKELSKKLGYEVLSNDLGYERNGKGGYDVHCDEAGFPKAAQDEVAQTYAELVGEKVFVDQMGYTAAERNVLADGSVEVIYEQYS